jgi:hypothetical protein
MSAVAASRLAVVRAAMRQVRVYLEHQGGVAPGEKRNAMISRYFAAKGYVVEPSQSLYDKLTDVFYSGADPDVTVMDRGFYETGAWKRLRRKVLKYYGCSCMRCGAADAPTVDHVKPRSLFPDLSLEFDNMQVLCQPCNSAKSNRHQTDYRAAA